MRSSVSRLRTERKQTLRAAVLAVLFCLFLAGCGDDIPDLSRDSVKRTAAPAAETERGAPPATGGDSGMTPQDGILTADPDADHYTPYY